MFGDLYAVSRLAAGVAVAFVNGIKGFPVSPPANPAAMPVIATTAPAS